MRAVFILIAFLLTACTNSTLIMPTPARPSAPTELPTQQIVLTATPRLTATSEEAAVNKLFTISSLDSAFIIAGVVTGTVNVDMDAIDVRVEKITFVHKDNAQYKGPVELLSISADITEINLGKYALSFRVNIRLVDLPSKEDKGGFVVIQGKAGTFVK